MSLNDLMPYITFFVGIVVSVGTQAFAFGGKFNEKEDKNKNNESHAKIEEKIECVRREGNKALEDFRKEVMSEVHQRATKQEVAEQAAEAKQTRETLITLKVMVENVERMVRELKEDLRDRRCDGEH